MCRISFPKCPPWYFLVLGERPVIALDFIINYFHSGKVLFPIAGISNVLQIYVGLEIFEKLMRKGNKRSERVFKGCPGVCAALTPLWAQTQTVLKWLFSILSPSPLGDSFAGADSLPSPGDESQSWDHFWMPRLRMWAVLVSPALPCPSGGVFCFLWHSGVSQGTTEVSWQLPGQSLGLGAATAQQELHWSRQIQTSQSEPPPASFLPIP